MSQYAHFPVKGDTFWQRYRNACFQWIKWWDFPVMTCAECGVRIIPSIPAMILNDVCYMIGLFFLPLGIVFSGLASAVDLRYLLSLACFLLWLFTIAGLSRFSPYCFLGNSLVNLQKRIVFAALQSIRYCRSSAWF